MKKISVINRILFWLEKYLAAGFILLLGSTWRYKIQQADDCLDRKLYFFWHRNILPITFFHKFHNYGIMISNSKDGELIAGPVSLLGYQIARGSSRRGAVTASKTLLKISRKNSIALTIDGPKGPAGKIKIGMLQMAFLSKLPIIPVAVDVKNEIVFKSWDKFRLPHAFTTINISYGKPCYINNKDQISEMMLTIQDEMDRLTIKNKIER